MTVVTKGSKAVGSFAVIRPIGVRGSITNCQPQLSNSEVSACLAVTFFHFSVMVGGVMGIERPSGPTVLRSLGSN